MLVIIIKVAKVVIKENFEKLFYIGTVLNSEILVECETFIVNTKYDTVQSYRSNRIKIYYPNIYMDRIQVNKVPTLCVFIFGNLKL